MTTGKRALIWIGTVALVLLNWAALDDITTGRQPNFILEYSFVIASVLLLVGWLFLSWRRRAARSGINKLNGGANERTGS